MALNKKTQKQRLEASRWRKWLVTSTLVVAGCHAVNTPPDCLAIGVFRQIDQLKCGWSKKNLINRTFDMAVSASRVSCSENAPTLSCNWLAPFATSSNGDGCFESGDVLFRSFCTRKSAPLPPNAKITTLRARNAILYLNSNASCLVGGLFFPATTTRESA